MFNSPTPSSDDSKAANEFDALSIEKRAHETDLVNLGQFLMENADKFPINLIKLTSHESISSIRTLFPTGPLVVCDFPLDGVESWERVSGGFYNRNEDILVVDHHAEHSDMYRFVSSGNLACEYVRKNDPSKHPIIISHTDCDSIISRLVMGGEIPPHEIFEKAVIAADHSGEANPIADLLQALDARRNFASSVWNLGALLSEHPLTNSAQQALLQRKRDREATERFVASGNYEIFINLRF